MNHHRNKANTGSPTQTKLKHGPDMTMATLSFAAVHCQQEHLLSTKLGKIYNAMQCYEGVRSQTTR